MSKTTGRKAVSALKKKIQKLEKAIKQNCYDCCGFQKKYDCKLRECSLFPYRHYKSKK